jgi:hypothetical protein
MYSVPGVEERLFFFFFFFLASCTYSWKLDEPSDTGR